MSKLDPLTRIKALSKKISPDETARLEAYVRSHFNEKMYFNENEMSALISFVHSLHRKESFGRSKIVNLINQNQRIDASKEMRKPQWCKVNGVINNRRKRLRNAQADLFIRMVCIMGGKQ